MPSQSNDRPAPTTVAADPWGLRARLPGGVGLGLRWAFLDEVDAEGPPPSLPFFEIAPENYMRRGGFIARALHRLRERVPILSHGLMLNVGGTTSLDPDYLGHVASLLDALGTAVHTDHLCWTGADGYTLHDLLPLPTDVATARHCAERAQRVAEALGRPLALENISHYARLGGGLAEAEFITEVLERADAGLMLDVGNVVVNATNYGFCAEAFIEALPLHRVVQMHVAGAERKPHLDGLLIDTHGAEVPPAAAALMALVVQRIGPVPVVLERDANIPALPVLLDEVASLQARYDDALARFDEAQRRASTPSIANAPAGALAIGARPHGAAGTEGVLRGMQSIVVNASPPQPDATAAALANNAAIGRAEAEMVLSATVPRLAVYRRLVRNGLWSCLTEFVPRARARMGPDVFCARFDAWLADAPPRSRVLRDAPGEFVAHWVYGDHRDSDPIAADLARYEIAHAQVEAAPCRSQVEVEARIDLQAPLVLHDTLRLLSFRYPVHEPEFDAAPDPPSCPTWLALYRDADDEVRVMTLSPLAFAVLDALGTGATVAQAAHAAAEHTGDALTPEVLGRLSAVLADFAERGVVRGCPAAAQSGTTEVP